MLHSVQIAHSIIKDVDLDEFFENEMETLRDSGLFDLMRALVRMLALQIRCTAKEAVVKCLRNCLEKEVDQLKKYKDGICTSKDRSPL
nr:hypothetical protein CFP56_10848 [Quercus suber]